LIRICAFTLLCAVTISGCEKTDRSGTGSTVPVELRNLRSNAWNCWQDSGYAPVEHSEHCVAVAENYLDSLREECERVESIECDEYDTVMYETSSLYSDAIIESLVNFGIPEWIKDEKNREFLARHSYLNGKLMRRLFDECLKTEKRELAKNGLQPATSITDTPLQDGQKCFRINHPEFRTEPIHNS
jgi:hypothetical protein